MILLNRRNDSSAKRNLGTRAKKLGKAILLSCTFISSSHAIPYTPDWSENAVIGKDGHRKNVFQLPQGEFKDSVLKGREHASQYPVSVTGLLLSEEMLMRGLEVEAGHPLIVLLSKVIPKELFPGDGVDSIYQFLNLPYYQDPILPEFRYQIPKPLTQKDEDPLGVSYIERFGTMGVTFSCAACHSANLFGKTILGLTNRFPKANDFFVLGKAVTPLADARFVRKILGTSKESEKLLIELKKNIKFIEGKNPATLGLDTSLAHTALSLSRRAKDAWATRNPKYAKRPHHQPLRHKRADSKPMPWWNMKYKTKWLSDGSVVSGNPIYTNILWNEIGRGVDLHKLAEWFEDNQHIIQELTSAVFATEAPRYVDFFGEKSIDIKKAIRGQKIFNQSCSGCHGNYVKGWNKMANSLGLSPEDVDLRIFEKAAKASLKTEKVNYHKVTPVIDVGTDPLRYQGMKYFSEDLNRLEISKRIGVKVVPQKGYIPPPLVGIWSRWPYFHNNSASSLCEVLTPSKNRLKVYYARPANDPSQDFDSECNGYPRPSQLPWYLKLKKYRFDTRKTGMSRSGHDEGIFIKNGKEVLSRSDKMEIIEFLKTL